MNETKYFQKESSFLLNTINEGDGLELLRDLKDEVAQLVIFDPQYKNAKISARHIRENYHPLPHFNQENSDIKCFFYNLERVLKSSSFCLLWIDDVTLLKLDWLKSWLTPKLKAIEILTWSKGNYVGLGTNYFRKNTEFSLLIQKEPFVKKVKDKSIKNLFIEIVNFTQRHNTHQKPLKMTQAIIQQLTNEGDLVIDPCAGSFVSLRACQSLKRNFLGTDLTLRELMKFNINKERSRELLKKEAKLEYD